MNANAQGDGHVIHLKGKLSFLEVVRIARAHTSDFPMVRLDPEVRDRMVVIRGWLEKLIPRRVMYGINTGCGSNRNKIIPLADLIRYQKKYIMTHAVGFGQPLPREVVRAMMLLRVNSFSLNNSAMTVQLCELILDLLNMDITPVIPEFGSVGASGDLVPLAHLGAVLIGLPWAEVFYKGERRNAREVFTEVKLEHHVLQPKEAMGLTNGATFILANAALGVHDAFGLLTLANLGAALHAEAIRGELNAFDARIHEARHQDGQQIVASELRDLLAGSLRTTSEAQKIDFPDEKKRPDRRKRKGSRVQDAYSLRCAPQAHGAVYDALLNLATIVQNEINASTDNPLVFAGKRGKLSVLSGGNFHGDPLAIPLDAAIIALAKLASISNARLYRLLNPAWSFGLPADLAGSDDEDNTALMIAQYAVASRVMHAQGLAGAAFSALSIPTSMQQEDYVSNGANSAWGLRKTLGDLRSVLAVELLAGCQAVDLGTPHLGDLAVLGQGTKRGYDCIRQYVPMMHEDRSLYPDIQRVRELVTKGELLKALEHS
ncbi:MAG: Histidine ammonia-lyase [Parcubacteria group bacterium GW2011_GWA2_40_23]|nr:MAG: Histidine ammonia-lyase [Parcubacteria group bacterium GW2011_GWA2_40_23]